MNNDEIDSIVKNISEGIGNYQDNISILKKYGERAITVLLNAESTHLPGYRDGRDSVADILGAIVEISKAHKEFVIKLFAEEMSAPPKNQKYISSLAWVLGFIDEKKAVPSLIEGLKHSDKWIRWACCEALLKLKSNESIPALVEALRDRAELVKSTAVAALKEFGTTDAIPHLEKLAKSKKKGISENAEEAIKLIRKRALHY